MNLDNQLDELPLRFQWAGRPSVWVRMPKLESFEAVFDKMECRRHDWSARGWLSSGQKLALHYNQQVARWFLAFTLLFGWGQFDEGSSGMH